MTSSASPARSPRSPSTPRPMAYPLGDRLAVTTLVHVALTVLTPAGAGQTWAVTFSVSVVLLCGAALNHAEEKADKGEQPRR